MPSTKQHADTFRDKLMNIVEYLAAIETDIFLRAKKKKVKTYIHHPDANTTPNK